MCIKLSVKSVIVYFPYKVGDVLMLEDIRTQKHQSLCSESSNDAFTENQIDNSMVSELDENNIDLTLSPQEEVIRAETLHAINVVNSHY